MRRILYFIISLIILSACDMAPSGILSQGKMEDVLYDYHLAQAMINGLSGEERDTKGQLYLDAVFEKHDITQAEFDSSLVWYNQNTKYLAEIYENLQKRYEQTNKELQLKNGNNDMMAVFTVGGDTTNIWSSSKLLILRDRDLINKESFTIKADTSFHLSDTFVFMCKVNMILENRNERSEYVSIGLTINYKNGKSIGATRQAYGNGIQQISLNTNDSVDIKSITGFFYFKGNKNYRSTAFIDDIQLIRMHKHVDPVIESVKDSVKEDEIKDTIITEKITADTIGRRLSPEQMRNLNVPIKRIEIKAAPEVRTPNQYGKRKIRKQ